MILDPLFLLIAGPFFLLALLASMRVKSTFRRFQDTSVLSGMTGAQAAAAVAHAGGAQVRIERVDGFLSDHYDPRTRTLRLSPEVYDGRSIAAIAVAAHEAGHSIQHIRQYAPLGLRSMVVPAAGIGQNLWPLFFFAGLIFFEPLLWVALVLFAGTVVFQLVTLPVEFDASRRAKAVLAETGIVSSAEEAAGVSQVLGAAAMTYVAGALTSIATLLYLFIRARD